MKKLKNKAILIALLFVAVSLLCISKSNAVTYKDYDDDETLDVKYSYGTLFWTDDTEVIDNGSSLTDDRFKLTEYELPEDADLEANGNKTKYVIGGYEGDTIKIKITNCAVDEDGDLCDVEIEVYNIESYGDDKSEGRDEYAYWGYDATYVGDDNSDNDTYTPMDVCIRVMTDFPVSVKDEESGYYTTSYEWIDDSPLIRFSLSANRACTDFKMTYYKHDKTTAANINGTVSTIYDIDVPAAASVSKDSTYDNTYSTCFLKGNEGVSVSSSSTIYYSQNDYLEEYSSDNAIGTADDIYNDQRTEDNVNTYGTEGMAESTSAMFLEDDGNVYTMKYGGVGCGIYFIFASYIPFEMTGPVKSVDDEDLEVYVGDTFHYTVAQYIPNNYYYTILMEDTSVLYSSLVITDELDENLEITETSSDKITITNVEGEDCSDWFTIKTDGNTVSATAVESAMSEQGFYNQTFYLTIPVVAKEATAVSEIPNTAKTTITTSGGDSNSFESNEVIVNLKYRVTVTVTVENGTGSGDAEVTVEPGEDNTFKITITPNDGYSLSTVTVDGKSVDISELTLNSDGSYTLEITDENILENIDHVVVAKCVKDDDETTAKDEIPYTGVSIGIAVVLVVAIVVAIVIYIRKKRLLK